MYDGLIVWTAKVVCFPFHQRLQSLSSNEIDVRPVGAVTLGEVRDLPRHTQGALQGSSISEDSRYIITRHVGKLRFAFAGMRCCSGASMLRVDQDVFPNLESRLDVRMIGTPITHEVCAEHLVKYN